MFNVDIDPKVWRLLGFMSCVVGFICYALSPSFHDLFGHWTLWKLVFYPVMSTIFSILTLFMNKCPRFSGAFLLKAHVGFLALMLTSLYTFYSHDGRDEKGLRRNILSLGSFAAFAFMSVSLSKQIQPEFDAGMSNFFLGCLIVAVMKMNIKVALGVSALFYVLITVRSCWDSMQIGDTNDLERAIMARQLSEIMLTLARDDNNGDEECHIEMPSLDNEGHWELDAIEEIREETCKGNHNEELDIWFQAFKGAQPNDEHSMVIMDTTMFLT